MVRIGFPWLLPDRRPAVIGARQRNPALAEQYRHLARLDHQADALLRRILGDQRLQPPPVHLHHVRPNALRRHQMPSRAVARLGHGELAGAVVVDQRHDHRRPGRLGHPPPDHDRQRGIERASADMNQTLHCHLGCY